MHHRASGSYATLREIAASGAGGSVGLRNLDGEQAEDQQAGSKQLSIDILPRSRRFARLPAARLARLSSEVAARRLTDPEVTYFPPDLASASLQPSLRSAACDLMHAAIAPLPA